jgi:putative transposase
VHRTALHPPAKPNKNAFIEQFNRTFRAEMRNANLFEDLGQVREVTHQWIVTSNEQRPHDTLGGLPPGRLRAMTKNEKITSKLSI